MFPYLNKIYTDEERIDIFKKLLNTDLKKLKLNKSDIKINNIRLKKYKFMFQNNYHILISEPDFYENFGILSATFIDECKAVCKFAHFDTPLEYYNKHKTELDGITNLKEKRDKIYFGLNKMECSNHNPILIKYFIKMFNAKRILDPSSGWGDRLLGAMSCDIDLYISTDPNTCLHPFYKQMIELLKPYSPNKTMEIINLISGFETCDISKYYNSIDLIYTSPPYFNYEVYTNETSQSMANKNESEWVKSFLIPFLNKCYDSLKINGHLVLYFSQPRGCSYIEFMFKYIDTELLGFVFMGSFIYATINFKGAHPIFLFKKIT